MLKKWNATLFIQKEIRTGATVVADGTVIAPVITALELLWVSGSDWQLP
jgi:hypothetical protein